MPAYASLSGLAVALIALSACVHSAVYTQRVEARHPPSGTDITVEGARVHVLRAGDTGPPVLLIHGASANAREFSWSLAPRLDERFRVLMPDRPGHGYSGRPGEAWRLGVQAGQMAGVLDTLAPGEKAVIVGHSYGGAVALRLALDRPELVRGVVLLAPVTHDWGGGGEAWYNDWASPPGLGHAFSQLVPIVGPARVEASVDDVFDPAAPPPDYFTRAGIGLLFRPSAFRANARDMTRLREEVRAQQDSYPALDVPVVVFSGKKDTVINPRLHAGRLVKDAPDVTLVSLPDEGHMPHHGEGEAVAAAIARLAAGRPAGGDLATAADAQ